MRKISFNNLRKKTWFRYLKAFYFISFIGSAILIMSDSISILRPTLSHSESYIQCDSGARYGLANEGMQMPVNGALSAADDRLAKRLCVSDETIGELARASGVAVDQSMTNAELGKSIKDGRNFMYQNLYLLLAPQEKNYSAVEVYNKPSPVTTIAWLVVPVLLLVAIFELELRIFYYIMLGKFLPEKPARYLFFKVRY